MEEEKEEQEQENPDEQVEMATVVKVVLTPLGAKWFFTTTQVEQREKRKSDRRTAGRKTV